MAYNYDEQVPTWTNEGTEPASSVKTEGFKAGYKPPAAYFNWFWSHVLKWIADLRTKLSSLHTQVGTLETKVTELENADYDVTASDVLTKLKTVDGEGSGLDADTLDGKDSSYFATANHTHTQYAGTNHTHAVATETTNGFLSSELFSKIKDYDPDNLSTYVPPSTHPASMITGLSKVATSGNYADLVNKPVLSAVATSNDYNDLKNIPAPYTHPATHPASMIEETENIKMFLAEERAKLAGIEAQANKYVHPNTHPATMISGLAEYMATLGYGKVATGSYIGDGTGRFIYEDKGTYSTTFVTITNIFGDINSKDKNHLWTYEEIRTIILPFNPSVLFICDGIKVYPYILTPNRNTFNANQLGVTNSSSDTNTQQAYKTPIVGLKDNKLNVIDAMYSYDSSGTLRPYGGKGHYGAGFNISGTTYHWVAVA